MVIGYMYDLQAYPPRGGNHRHVFELIAGFVQRGHSVTVVEDPTMPDVVNHAGDSEGLTAFANSIDVLYVRVDARSIYKWEALSRCVERLSDETPIVWEINSPSDERLAFSWMGGDYSENEGPIRRFRRWLHARRQGPEIRREEQFRRTMAKRVFAAICVSGAVARYAEEQLGLRDTLALPNAGPLVSEEEIMERRGRRSDPTFTVLYSGSAIYPWQGINYLARVIELANDRGEDMRFVLAVNQRTERLPSRGNVEVREGLNQDEVRDAMCMADVCVALPPEWPWTPYGFHGSPMKLFEYMASMTAMVTSDLGQMREILHDGVDAILVETQPEAILEKLIYLRDHPEHRSAIGRAAWERVHTDLNWGYNVDQTLAVFERALTPKA